MNTPVNRDVSATLKYVRQFKRQTLMIKIGGSILQDDELLDHICDDLASIRSVGIRVILVHGGGPAINQELERRNIKWDFIGGLRVTTPEMMQVIEMVLCGQVNRRIVKALNRHGIKAVGISGLDASTITCTKADRQLGLVGNIENINPQLIHDIMNMRDDFGYRGIPVMAPIGLGRDGLSYNINADWVASKVASALGVTKVIFLSDQDGILDRQKKLIPELDAGELEALIEHEVVTGGMLAKTKTVLHAIKHGVTDVHIINGKRPNSLIEELFTEQGVGTVCRMRSRAHTKQEINL